MSVLDSHLNLATIEVVHTIEPIPDADAVESIWVLGNRMVVKKGEFAIGQKIVYHKTDTIVPSGVIYDFLKSRKYRIDPIKIRGVVSQGLVMSLETVFGKEKADQLATMEEGCDLTSQVGIAKYTKPEVQTSQPTSKKRISTLRDKPEAPVNDGVLTSWPSYLQKTDEPNGRNSPNLIKDMKGLDVVITLKMDGSSATFFVKDGIFSVCSRNYLLEEKDTNDYWIAAKKYDLPNKLKEYSLSKKINFCVQGELYGPKIQNNKMGETEKRLALFNLFNINAGSYMDHDELEKASAFLGIPLVPIIYRGILSMDLKELIQLSNEQNYLNQSPAEGIVIRTAKETRTVKNVRMSCKLISERFL